jgi:hypothetical protein
MSDLDLDATAIESLCGRGVEEVRALADKAFDAIVKRITA